MMSHPKKTKAAYDLLECDPRKTSPLKMQSGYARTPARDSHEHEHDERRFAMPARSETSRQLFHFLVELSHLEKKLEH